MKKTFALLLMLAFIVPAMFSCSPSSEESVSETTSEETVQIKDMGGREFNILCWDFGAGSNSILGYSGEVLYDEENPSSVDEAKKLVIDKIEADYNCKISGVMESTTPTPTTIRNQVSSGTAEYDLVFDCIRTLSPLVADGMLVDLNTVSTLKLSDPWWDQNAVADLSIRNKLYFACGDINTYDNQGTWCILFNKSLKKSLGISDDFYALARDGEWTFDKFTEICRSGITQNTNGDAVLDEFDTWALGTETYNIYVHVVSAGQKIARKDDDDVPYLTVSKEPEATYNALSKILDFYNDKQTVMVANYAPYTNKGYSNVWEATVHKAFVEGRELFYMCGLINVASFRTMSDEFGILPIPKFYKEQDGYLHTVSVDNMTVLCIPEGVADLDDVGIIISALSAKSKELVTPAYYDVQLKYRDTRDEESGEMLDIIFASRSFDIGASFNWGGILAQYMSMDTTVASRFESMISTAETALNDTLDAVGD